MTDDHRSSMDSPAVFAGDAVAASVPPQREAAAEAALFTFDHGAFEVSVVSDGYLVLPTALLAPDAPAAARGCVLDEGGSTAAEYEPAANLTLIRSRRDLILFDTGGVGYQPHMGMLSHNLAAAGINPASITKVVFTHGHPDHIWGTVLADGTLRFPNAAYYAGATEWDFWTSDDIWTKLPAEQHPFATGAQRQYAAVRDSVTLLRATTSYPESE